MPLQEGDTVKVALHAGQAEEYEVVEGTSWSDGRHTYQVRRRRRRAPPTVPAPEPLPDVLRWTATRLDR